MVAYDAIGNEDISEADAWQFAEITVVLGIKAGLDDIDQADRALLAGTGLEELFVARPDGAALELAFYQRKALLDFFLVRAGAVTTEEELHDVGRERVGLRVLAHKVLADEVALEGGGGDIVYGVHVCVV
jgi:hypothetical protein